MTSKVLRSWFVLVVAGTLLWSGSTLGQSSTPSPPPPASQPPATGQKVGPGAVDPGHPRVNQDNSRLGNQQQRIQQGVKNGTLGPQQAQRLSRNDQRVAHQEKQDLAANDGHLTKQEQHQLNRQPNKNGEKIYKEKHGQ
jgi:hypothetical protein